MNFFRSGAIFSKFTRANGPRVTQQDPKTIPRLMNTCIISNFRSTLHIQSRRVSRGWEALITYVLL